MKKNNKAVKSVNKKVSKKTSKKMTLKEKILCMVCLILPIVIFVILGITCNIFMGINFKYALGCYIGILILYWTIYDFINKKEKNKKAIFKLVILLVLAIFIICLNFSIAFQYRKNGYYKMDNTIYYCIEDDWYIYDKDWKKIEVMDYDTLKDFYLGYYYDDSYGGTNFIESEYWSNYYEEDYY